MELSQDHKSIRTIVIADDQAIAAVKIQKPTLLILDAAMLMRAG